MWNEILSGLIITGLLIILGRRIGKMLFPEESRGLSIAIGSLCALALFSITGAVVYYVAIVNILTLTLAGILTTFGILVATSKPHLAVSQASNHQSQPWAHILIVSVALLAWVTALFSSPITEAVRSPWLVLNPIAIIAPTVALLVSFAALKLNKSTGSILLFTTLFSIFASAAILFPLGYGFDPFLHRATIHHIAEYGTITPKPLYYIGEYAIELFMNILGGISIFTIDTLLVPLLAALTCTITARRLPLGVAIVLIAFSSFVVTTPQSLGYIFILLTIASSASAPKTRIDFLAPSIFALAACVAHPIAGVPAIIFVLFTALRQPILRMLLVGISAIALPALFILQATLNHANIHILWTNLWRLDRLPLTGFLGSQGNTWLDAMYLIIENIPVIIIFLALLGAIFKRKGFTSTERNSGIVSATLIISFILVSLGIDFTYLISYERQDFALRFLILATLFALPLADAGIAHISSLIQTKKLCIPAFIVSFIVISASIYGAFPRHDGYARSAAFNVSQADLDTVYAIHAKEPEDGDYIVLSNQATASAALQEFGFRKYYHGDIFYYPIPTGGVLYQHYLSMVNDAPSKETMNLAMQTAGVHTAYFVLNDYWWRHDAILETAKQETDTWFSINNGKTTVFMFTDDENVR